MNLQKWKKITPSFTLNTWRIARKNSPMSAAQKALAKADKNILKSINSYLVLQKIQKNKLKIFITLKIKTGETEKSVHYPAFVIIFCVILSFSLTVHSQSNNKFKLVIQNKKHKRIDKFHLILSHQVWKYSFLLNYLFYLCISFLKSKLFPKVCTCARVYTQLNLPEEWQ